MGLTQIAASILTSILVGALTRGTKRTYSLLALSVLAIYWFQPVVPLRYFDFWFPSLSLALVILTWLVISGRDSWKEKQNVIGLLIIVGIITVVDLSRYIISTPILTETTSPPFIQYLIFLVVIVVITLLPALFSHRLTWILSIVIVFLTAILVVLKSPALSLQISIFFRTLSGRPTELASSLDLKWLGFSYIAFRLIHVLRDKQMKRLPELSLPEFATYVVFFPTLAAGPIDRAERFVKDLQKEFVLNQDELLIGGSTHRNWSVQEICRRRYAGTDRTERLACNASLLHRLDVDTSLRLHLPNLF